MYGFTSKPKGELLKQFEIPFTQQKTLHSVCISDFRTPTDMNPLPIQTFKVKLEFVNLYLIYLELGFANNLQSPSSYLQTK